MLENLVWGIFLQEGVGELLENGSDIAQASGLAKDSEGSPASCA